MRILVATTYVPFHAEHRHALVDGVVDALRQRGHHTDAVRLPLNPSWPQIAPQMLALRCFDLSDAAIGQVDRLIALDIASAGLRHPAKIAWLVPHDRDVTTLWGSLDEQDAPGDASRALHAANSRALDECRAVFAASRAAARQLEDRFPVTVAGVYPPPLLAAPTPADDQPGLRPPFDDYFLLAAPLTPHSRAHVALEALALTMPGVRLVIAGAAVDPAYCAQLQRQIDQRAMAARVALECDPTPERLASLVAHTLAVIAIPYDAPFDTSAARALSAGQPVVTFFDAGMPAERVTHEATGLVLSPTAQTLAAALDRLQQNRDETAALRQNVQNAPDPSAAVWEAITKGVIG